MAAAIRVHLKGYYCASVASGTVIRGSYGRSAAKIGARPGQGNPRSNGCLFALVTPCRSRAAARAPGTGALGSVRAGSPVRTAGLRTLRVPGMPRILLGKLKHAPPAPDSLFAGGFFAGL